MVQSERFSPKQEEWEQKTRLNQDWKKPSRVDTWGMLWQESTNRLGGAPSLRLCHPQQYLAFLLGQFRLVPATFPGPGISNISRSTTTWASPSGLYTRDSLGLPAGSLILLRSTWGQGLAVPVCLWIPVFRRWRLECLTEANLGYTGRPCFRKSKRKQKHLRTY